MNEFYKNTLVHLRKIGFGGTLGGGVFGLMYIIIKSLILPSLTVAPMLFIYVGILLGFGLNGLIDRIARNISPFTRFLKYHFNMIDLKIAARSHQINLDTVNEIRDALTKERYIGHIVKENKQTLLSIEKKDKPEKVKRLKAPSEASKKIENVHTEPENGNGENAT